MKVILIRKFIILIMHWAVINVVGLAAQDDLLSLLGDEEETTQYAEASFKANRIINLHSIENTKFGVIDVKISHRFGRLNGGFYEFFGLDQANMRFGFDYGLMDRLQIGVGRSNFEKTYDGYIKYKLLRQSKGKKNMPISLSVLSGMAIKTTKWADTSRTNYFSSRLYYNFQVLIARKFSENFTFQLTPGLLHRNLVATVAEENDVYSIGLGLRQKLTKRLSLNAEYIYVLPNQLAPESKNSLSVGIDIETGGHVFQLHFTNSVSMIEKGVIAETYGEWGKGDIHFGFNLSRVFTLARKKEI
ncbi:MAG: DUF5777 family beta-barrel protein [Bacteroidota bacterium]|nr:DUF5777 family beta-barrel protein [Bacteroidota bacterium]